MDIKEYLRDQEKESASGRLESENHKIISNYGVTSEDTFQEIIHITYAFNLSGSSVYFL